MDDLAIQARAQLDPCLSYFKKYAQMHGLGFGFDMRELSNCYLQFVVAGRATVYLTASPQCGKATRENWTRVPESFAISAHAFPSEGRGYTICTMQLAHVPSDIAEAEFFEIVTRGRKLIEKCINRYYEIGALEYFAQIVKFSDDWQSVFNAISPLANMNTKESLGLLLRYIDRYEVGIRIALAYELANFTIDDAAVSAALKTLIKDSDASVRDTAAKSLATVEGRTHESGGLR